MNSESLRQRKVSQIRIGYALPIMNRKAEMLVDGISPEIDLKALFSRWPATIPVFLHHHLSCVGCSMSAFDTLEDALANYQLDWPTFRSELLAAMGKSSESNGGVPA